MIRCVIIEDEHLARQKLELYVREHPKLDLKASYGSAEDFLNQASKVDFDLLLLDIGLPNIDGIGLAGRLPEKAQVIFTTAYSEYAVKAFDMDATDYLLKPFDFKRFSKAVAKVGPSPESTEPALKQENTLVIREGKTIHRIPTDSILYIKGLKEYVVWHTEQGKLITLHSLAHLKEYLRLYGFIQTHKSYIVNALKVNRMDYGFVYLHKAQIPIGRSFRSQVREMFKEDL